MRETLLAAVRSRTMWATDGDHAAVLEDDAVDEVEALLALDLVDPVTGAYLDLEVLHAAGSLVWQRALTNGVMEDLQDAVGLLAPVYDADPERVPPELRSYYAQYVPQPRLAIQRRAATPPARAVCTDYGLVLLRRYERTGEPEALAAGTTLFRWALAEVPPGDPGRRLCLENLFHAVEIQAELGDAAAARETIELARALVALSAGGNGPADIDVLDALRRHAERTGDVDALRVAVMAGERALEQTGADASERANLCMTLAMAVGALAAGTGDVSDLRRAACLGEEAARSILTGDPYRGEQLSNLGILWQRIYEYTGDAEALVAAVAAARAAVAELPMSHPDRPAGLVNLSVVLRLSAQHDGRLNELGEAVEVGREAVGLRRPGQDAALANLSTVLTAWYERTGDPGVLGEAVEAGRSALAAAMSLDAGGLDPESVDPAALGPETARVAANLSLALRLTHEHTGRLDVLREARAHLRLAVAATPDGHASLPIRLANLGSLLRTEYDRTEDVDTLREAVEVSEEAVEATPSGHPDLAGRQSNLGIALFQLYDRGDNVETLRRAVGVTAAAVHNAGPPELKARVANNLATYLRILAEVTGDVEYLIGATTAVRAAVLAVPADHLERANYLIESARVALAAYEETGDDRFLSGGREALAEATDWPGLHVLERVVAGRLLARIDSHAGESDAALRVMQEVVTLLPQVADKDLHQPDRAHRLGQVFGVGAHAAAVALSAGRPELAVTLLEQARGRLLAEAMGRYSLPEIERDQADQPGVVVIINIHSFRCDALVVTSETVRHVPLPSLTHPELVGRAERFNAAIAIATTSTDLLAREQAEQVMTQVLGWLWDTTAEPVLAALGHTAPVDPAGPVPRVWWCPVGVLAFLPIHAAGHHRDGSGRSVLDRVVSSYTATVRALYLTRGRRPAAPGPALVVAVPDERVPSVHTEVTRLTALLPDATVLAGPDATRERVLAALADHPVLHVTGHAVSDRADPDASRLLLHDAPLTVADLRELHLVEAELAFLSACDTSRTRPALVDEAVHLTAAFQLAGYRHVVGTWWPVNDSVAASLAGDVHAELTAGGTRAPETAGTALALHRAVLQLRTDFPDRPSLWAAHGHTGL